MTGHTASRAALIIGASSMLGRELANGYAASGWRLILAGRDADELRRVASDVTIRHQAEVDTIALDLANSTSIDEAGVVIRQNGIPEVIIFVAGDSTGSAEAPFDPGIAQNLLAVNYAGPTRLIAALLPMLGRARRC